MSWWIRPLVRLVAAILLPLAVPAVITAALWALPGDPTEILCPPGTCTGAEALAKHWGLDQGPLHFYTLWLTNAFQGEFGTSWRMFAGMEVYALLAESLPMTGALVLLSMLPLLVGSVLAAAGYMPQRLDAVWQGLGLLPAVILALAFAAAIQITYGIASTSGTGAMLRLLAGAVVLGVADGALAGAVLGTRSTFEEEMKQRYVGIAILRGESALSNTLPNVLPALVGQFRARVLHVLSGTVVVEVVLQISGLGELLWDGTLLQDFGVVLAAAWAYSLISAALLLVQALVEVGVALYVRRSPAGVVDAVGATA